MMRLCKIVELFICFYYLSDEDECASGSAQCYENADCVNTVGSYGCTCKDGYTADGFVCASEEVTDN